MFTKELVYNTISINFIADGRWYSLKVIDQLVVVG
jgi:hypothetical protein